MTVSLSDMLSASVGQCFFLTELLLIEVIFLIPQPRRNHFARRVILSAAITYLFAIFAYIPPSHLLVTLKYFLLLALTAAGIIFCFQLSFWQAFYIATLCIILQHTGYSLIMLAETIFHRSFLNMTLVHCVIYVTIGISEYFFLSWHLLMDCDFKDNNQKIIILSCSVIFITIFLNSFREIFSNRSDESLTLAAGIYSTSFCIFALILMISIPENRQLQRELGIVKQLWASDQKQYELSKQNLEMLHMYCHDLKHFIRHIDNASDSAQYRQEVSASLSVFESLQNTGNHALDVILSEKILYCSQNGITFTSMADGKSMHFISSIDLYSIFGNLLSNAIEAVEKISNPDKRIISLTSDRSNDMLKIHIENYYTGPLRFAAGLPETTKPDCAVHGFGLKSVRLIIEKYNGNLSIDYTDEIFYVNILIPVPAPKR